MEVALVSVDAPKVNRALMQISSYHKNKGDKVYWHKPLFQSPDITYLSKLFNFTPDYQYIPADCKVVRGGSGYDVKSKLDHDIAKADLDYSIYPDCDYSIQFFSRGCIRNCPFCIVREKEGYIRPVEPDNLNPRGKYIEILDNNFFANPEWKKASEQIIEWGQPVNMQGVDARILTEEHAHYLNKFKHIKQIHIAWDNPKEDLVPKLKDILKHIKAYKLMCYVLIGYWSTPEEDLYRVEKLRELKIDPFVMPFDKSDTYQRNFARWVNMKAVWRTVKWEDYRKTS